MCVYIYIYIYIHTYIYGQGGEADRGRRAAGGRAGCRAPAESGRRQGVGERGRLQVLLRGVGTLRYLFILSEKLCLSSAHLCSGSLMV